MPWGFVRLVATYRQINNLSFPANIAAEAFDDGR
jgi:hypothetical protein